MEYQAGQRLRLTKEQVDDNDGEERVTPAGSIVVIERGLDRTDGSHYAVGCPETGAMFWFDKAELDAETESILDEADEEALRDEESRAAEWGHTSESDDR